MQTNLLISPSNIEKIKVGQKVRDYRALNDFYIEKFLQEVTPEQPFDFQFKVSGKTKYYARKRINTIAYKVGLTEKNDETINVQLKTFYLYGLEAINAEYQSVIEKCYEFDGQKPLEIMQNEYDVANMQPTDFVFVLRLGDVISQ